MAGGYLLLGLGLTLASLGAIVNKPWGATRTAA